MASMKLSDLEAMESNLKIVLSVIVLIAASGAVPSFAKDARGHHGTASPQIDAGKAARSKTHARRGPGAGVEDVATVRRNAIGAKVLSHPGAPAGGGEGPRIPGTAGAAALGAVGNSLKSIGGAGVPVIHTQNVVQHLVVDGGVGSRGRIGGVGLIRPVPVSSGLGGPARTVVGIDGTTVHRKH
jgi:hypothetical protein